MDNICIVVAAATHFYTRIHVLYINGLRKAVCAIIYTPVLTNSPTSSSHASCDYGHFIYCYPLLILSLVVSTIRTYIKAQEVSQTVEFWLPLHIVNISL